MKSTPSSVLYKYQKCSGHAFENLSNIAIRFSKPSAFNDPFDSTFIPEIRRPTDSVVKKFIELQKSKFRTFTAFREFEKLYMDPDGNMNQEAYIQELIDASKKHFESRRLVMMNDRGVCCFAERNNNMLLWSHYANGHAGFCLEFDTSFAAPEYWWKVEYSEEIPSFEPLELILDDDKLRIESAFMRLTSTKANCWKYEEEWRLYHKVGGINYHIGGKYLKNIYLGCKISKEDRIHMLELANQLSIQIYDMVIVPGKFAVEPKPII